MSKTIFLATAFLIASTCIVMLSGCGPAATPPPTEIAVQPTDTSVPPTPTPMPPTDTPSASRCPNGSKSHWPGTQDGDSDPG